MTKNDILWNIQHLAKKRFLHFEMQKSVLNKIFSMLPLKCHIYKQYIFIRCIYGALTKNNVYKPA